MPMEINLHEKRFVILGLQGSGKTTLAKYIAKQNPRHLVFDVIGEYQGFNRYLPREKQGQGLISEFEICANKLLLKNLHRFNMLIIDEANRIAPCKKPMPSTLLMLNDQHRHYGLSLGVIARRPSQLNTDLIDLAHYMFVFLLSGWHDVLYLNKIAQGLGDTVRTLKPYEFVVVTPTRQFTIHKPISLS